MGKRKAPYKVIFNNDCTNILSCTSPFHKKGEPFRPEMLEAAVDEADGVDAQLLSPGTGWVPWWKSDKLPIKEHHQWFRDTFKMEPESSFHDFLLDGGDIVKVFVDRCRLRGQAPFITLRLNDGHYLELLNNPKPDTVQSLSKFYVDHPEYRIGSNLRDWYERVQNWAIPAVRDHKFGFIEELCENYDLDGFELDFMRHCCHFQQDTTTSEQRRDIMTGFVARVRKLLDRTAKPGQHRWLSARIPCFVDTYDAMGIDPAAMVDAGLDMVNASSYYFTRQYHDVDRIRQMAPDAALYYEVTQGMMPVTVVGEGYNTFTFMRNNDHQIYTTANLVYDQGADGISIFNFLYYREHGMPERGPFNEPPFHVIPRLKDRAWLAKQAQWYYLAKDWNGPRRSGWQLERTVVRGHTETFEMKCAPGPHLKDGMFRIMASKPMPGRTWSASVNGTRLAPCECALKPLDHPYDACLGTPDQYACFTCPAAPVTRGANAIAVTLEGGDDVTLRYMDIVLPT